jgi:hypothetical protein
MGASGNNSIGCRRAYASNGPTHRHLSVEDGGTEPIVPVRQHGDRSGLGGSKVVVAERYRANIDVCEPAVDTFRVALEQR